MQCRSNGVECFFFLLNGVWNAGYPHARAWLCRCKSEAAGDANCLPSTPHFKTRRKIWHTDRWITEKIAFIKKKKDYRSPYQRSKQERRSIESVIENKQRAAFRRPTVKLHTFITLHLHSKSRSPNVKVT